MSNEQNTPRSELQKFGLTLNFSLDKTTKLYQIQSKNNFKDGKVAAVNDEDFYYRVLLKSHQLWNKLGLEMQLVFQIFNKDNWEAIVHLPELPPTTDGEMLLMFHYANPVFQQLLNEMTINFNTIEEHIQEELDT